MPTTRPATITPSDLAGPWRARYRVSRETLAVHVALATARGGNWWEENETTDLADLYTETARGVADLIADRTDTSIKGFWGRRLAALNAAQTASVRNLAATYLAEHRAARFGAPGDLYERFDGQH